MKISHAIAAQFPEAKGVVTERGGWQYCPHCRHLNDDRSEPKCIHILAYRARAHALEDIQ